MDFKTLMDDDSKFKIHDGFTYKIFQTTDGKIYNIDVGQRLITSVRDPLTTKFKVGDIVLVKPLGEYGEVVEVKKDEEWGNHQYDVSIFNDVPNSFYRDEHELSSIVQY